MKRRPRLPDLQPLLEGAPLLRIMELAADEALQNERYLPWRKLRFHRAPEGLTAEQWWLGIKLHRAQARRSLSLMDKKGRPFSYAPTDMMMQLLHRIDREAGGMIMTDSKSVLTPVERDRYLITSLAEESIMSSLLEGAAVTRSEARDLIRSERHPRTPHEQMVLNNYHTMQMILQHSRDPLTPDGILAIHRSMTTGTLRHPEQAGQLRRACDQVRIEDERTGDIIHEPPPAAELPQRMEALCRLANADDSPYLHPVLRAILLHFQLAYDHPFTDGNGRTARALFYRSMLRAGYWLFEYISISHEICLHPSSYYESFIDCEEDAGDLNYFILDQLNTILCSVRSLTEHVRNKQREHEQLEEKLGAMHELNHRQKALLLHLLRHPDCSTTVPLHCRDYKVVRQTARTDLRQLADLGLLRCTLQARTHCFSPVPHMEQRLQALARERAEKGR